MKVALTNAVSPQYFGSLRMQPQASLTINSLYALPAVSKLSLIDLLAVVVISAR